MTKTLDDCFQEKIHIDNMLCVWKKGVINT